MAITARRLLAATVVTAFLTQGCSLIGLGAGSASPKYERVEPPYASLAEGTAERSASATSPKFSAGAAAIGRRDSLSARWSTR
jgi:hypothetical protein